MVEGSDRMCRHGFAAGRCPLCDDPQIVVRLADTSAAPPTPDGKSPRKAIDRSSAEADTTNPTDKWDGQGAGFPVLEACLALASKADAADSSADTATDSKSARHSDVEQEFVDGLASLEEVLRLRKELEEVLSRGFFGIAQARYSLGSNRVGAAQYPSTFEPSSRINITGSLPDVGFELVPCLPSAPSSGASTAIDGRSRADPNQTADQATASTKGGDGELGLVKDSCMRSQESPVTSRSDMTDQAAPGNTAAAPDRPEHASDAALGVGLQGPSQKITSESKSRLNGHNPRHESAIRWFGVAVPHTLRSAEGDFKEALQITAKLAKAQVAAQVASSRFKLLSASETAF